MTNSGPLGSFAVEARPVLPAVLQSLPSAAAGMEQWVPWLAVFAQPSQGNLAKDPPPLTGHYEILEDGVRFTSQFPLANGMQYRARWNQALGAQAPDALKAQVSSTLITPARVLTPKTVVDQIYPTSSLLPENLLKFYIHFSRPMSRGKAYDHIQLLDAQERAVQFPFLEIDEELWDPTLKRLTLFIDPGRIKRGVKPLEDVGPSIEQGHTYTLAIRDTWKDADGAPLKETFRKRFEVGPADRTPLDASGWVITPPKAQSIDPLTLRFPEPVDHGLAQRVIEVFHIDTGRLSGHVTLADHEQLWRFVPEQPWRPGRHQIVANSILEDLAGNSIGKPFEVDVFDKVQTEVPRKAVALDFVIPKL